jgi:class 3 adenylate cyclase
MTEERRLVTVLFADVTGSTAMGEALDPEDLRALLARFYGIAREVIAAHGGTLEKFVGDAVMAVFGLPTAHGDDPARAIAAGLELRDRVRDDPGLGDQLPIRVAVNTGEVVASANAESGTDFLLTGDAVNVAARLVQWADPWRVVAGERTVHAAPEFAYGATESVEAKGKSVPVQAAEVVGRQQPRPASAAFFGRDDDLAQLELVARRSLADRRPYLVTIVAPAGTGKTRLLEAFLERVERQVPSVLTVTAQCLPYGQRLTFWPLRGILFELFGLPEETANDKLRTQVVERLSELGIADASTTAGLLLATIGAGEDETDDRAAVFAAWRDTFERFAADRPLVVVFEDLHWSSDVFLDLVEYVTQPRGEMPLLMLALTRPELLDRRPTWGGGRRNHLSIELAPLDDPAIEQLVEALLGSAPPGVAPAVARRAEGNPFFATELVRSITDRLGRAPGEEEAEAVMASLPDTVQATVLARLDALPAAERRSLQLGSVFGRSFSSDGLVALDPSAAAAAESSVAVLLDRDMIRINAGDGYRFRHILIREVAYGTLTRSERARLHAKAGEWLERDAHGREEALAELVAYHYREAATLAALLPADVAARSQAKAVEWLRRAADSALGAAAQLEAYAHLTKALDWAPPEQLPDIHERMGDTFLDGDTAGREFGLAYQLAKEQNRSVDERLRILGKQMEVETRWTGSVGQHISATDMTVLADEARELIPQATDLSALAKIHLALAGLPSWYSRFAGADVGTETTEAGRAEISLAISYARQADDAESISSALDVLSGMSQEEGDWVTVRDTALERLGLGSRLGILERIDANAMLIWSEVVRGELAEADRVGRQTLADLQPGQAPAWSMHLLAWHAVTLIELGKWDEVIGCARQMRELWHSLGKPAAGYALRGFSAAFDVARARREENEIEQWRSICLDLTTRSNSRSAPVPHIGIAYLASDIETMARHVPTMGPPRADFTSKILCRINDYRGAVARPELEVMLERAQRHGTPLVEAELHRSYGLIDSGADQLRQALQIVERCGSVFRAARLRHEIGEVTRDGGMSEQGLSELERIGDVDQLERYLVRRRSAATV